MMAEPEIYCLQAKTTPWEPYSPEGAVSGGALQYLRRPGEGGVSKIDHCGIWRGMLPPRHRVKQPMTETICVLKGHLLVEMEDGTKFELREGDSARASTQGQRVTGQSFLMSLKSSFSTELAESVSELSCRSRPL
jgi:uncharacterized cupin superfamily protein